MRNQISFYLNGKKKVVSSKNSLMMLSEYLRDQNQLIGTKVVCSEGDCGACTVLKLSPLNNDQYFKPVNSCIIPLFLLDGSSLITVDSLEDNNQYHESQKQLIEKNGSQCGFCTPGFIMSMSALSEKKKFNNEQIITEKESKNNLTANLCRCTGYESILNATTNIDLNKVDPLKKRFFNDELRNDLIESTKKGFLIKGENYSIYAPKNIQDALTYLNDNSSVKIIGFATDLGVLHNKHIKRFSHFLTLHLIEELYEIQQDQKTITIGARTSISDFRRSLKNSIPEFSKYLDVFASPQIKNVATLIGNIANASPIGDNACALLVLDGKIKVQSIHRVREIALEDFFLDYKKIDLKPNEIIISISIQIPEKTEYFKLYKNSIRKDLDISIVNFAIIADKTNENCLKKIMISAGGIAATPIRFYKTEKILQGQKIDSQLIDKALHEVQSEFKPLSDHRGSDTYRRIVIKNYLKRTLNEIKEFRP